MDQEDQGDHNPPWWTRSSFYILLMFIEDETVNQRNTSGVGEFSEGWGNSDSESELAILGHDLQSEQERGGDIEDDLDSEDISPCSQIN